MEAKKNPNKDIHRKSFQFFCIGLIISTALAISAFEWTTEKKIYPPREPESIAYDVILDVKPTVIEEVKVPEKKLEPLKTKPVIITPESITTAAIESTPQEPISFEPEVTTTEVSADSEESDPIVVFAEQQPIPINGYEGFYKMIGQNIKYPRPAARANIEGKVFVEFVVNKNGEPTDIKVTKGIGGGCDEEAMRVIALSKWQPGKQRGKPVRVRMIMPVIFKLNRG